jgi:hypothetical protein
MIGDELRRASKITMNLCYRIERLCKRDSLNVKEVSERAMKDRRIVEGFYCFYRQKGDSETTALKKAQANAIRVILTEELT